MQNDRCAMEGFALTRFTVFHKLERMMGGCISLAIAVLAAIVFFFSGHWILGSVSIGVTVLCFWSNGVMHNFAYAADAEWASNFRQNSKDAGMSDDEIESIIANRPTHMDIDAIPDWVSSVNMVATLVAAVLLVSSIVLWVRG